MTECKDRHPTSVMPPDVAEAVASLPWWFVIGGQAVRCLVPYRRSVDVDFGVGEVARLEDLLARLGSAGELTVLERSVDTAHVLWNGKRLSIFVLEPLLPHTIDQRLTVTGILATKLHAILDRGARRDFFDVYAILHRERLGIVAALEALREVYGARVKDGLLLRALTWFEDAEREARLPGEGPDDWKRVKDYFLTRVGDLLVPPGPSLDITAHVVDVREI